MAIITTIEFFQQLRALIGNLPEHACEIDIRLRPDEPVTVRAVVYAADADGSLRLNAGEPEKREIRYRLVNEMPHVAVRFEEHPDPDMASLEIRSQGRDGSKARWDWAVISRGAAEAIAAAFPFDDVKIVDVTRIGSKYREFAKAK